MNLNTKGLYTIVNKYAFRNIRRGDNREREKTGAVRAIKRATGVPAEKKR